MKNQFGDDLVKNLGLGEIVMRIHKINSLSNNRVVDDQKNLNRLKKFFAGVLPQSIVTRVPQFNDPPTKSVGSDISWDLGPDDHPTPWKLGIQYRSNNKKITIFNKTETQWSTDQQTYGNEVLDFVYNPVLGTFKLVTAWEQEGSESFLVGSQRLLIDSASVRTDKPSFLVASSDSQLLTPAPAMVWAVLSQAEQGRQLLLQDFNLKKQTRSNVHRIEFPEVEEVWRNEAIFKNGSPIDLTLHWLDRFPADYWSKLNLADISDELITNENGVEVKLSARQNPVPLSGLFQMDAAPFKGYDFKLQYKNVDGRSFQLTISIMLAPDAVDLKAKDLDRWMVQVLSSDGTKLHRSSRFKSKRHYILESQKAGGQKLVAIEHELTINREALDKIGYLGIANLDKVEAGTAKISKVPFPNWFKN